MDWEQPARVRSVNEVVRSLTRDVVLGTSQRDPWIDFRPSGDVQRFTDQEPELASMMPVAARVEGRRIRNVIRGRHSGRDFVYFQAVGVLARRENIVCVELPGEWPPGVHKGSLVLTPTQAVRRFATGLAADRCRDASVRDLRAGGRYVIGTLAMLDPDDPLTSVLAAVEALEAAVHAIPALVWDAITATSPRTNAKPRRRLRLMWPTARGNDTTFDRPWRSK
jgi:hypothetical protein